MAEARQSEDWNHTAAILALLANCHRDPKKTRPFKPADFHPRPPERPHRGPPAPKTDISILKAVFVERG